MKQTLNEPVAGIDARSWINFFKAFTDAADAKQAWDRIDAVLKKHFAAQGAEAERAASMLRELVALLIGEKSKGV